MLGIWNHPETGIDPDVRRPYIPPQNDPRWTHSTAWIPGVTDESPNYRAACDYRLYDANAAMGPARVPMTTPSVQENRLGIDKTPLGYNWGFAWTLRNVTPYPRRVSVPTTQAPGLQSNVGPSPRPTPVYEPSYLPPVCGPGGM